MFALGKRIGTLSLPPHVTTFESLLPLRLSKKL